MLCVSRTGLLDALGKSQILAYLKDLPKYPYIPMVSPEWRNNLSHGISWIDLRFRNMLCAQPAFLLRSIAETLSKVVRSRPELIQARTRQPARVARETGALTGTSFVFKARGFWREERITSRRPRHGADLPHVLMRVARLCLSQSTAVITMIQKLADLCRTTHMRAVGGKFGILIPTCAELDRFGTAPASLDTFVNAYHRSELKGWLRVEWLTRFLAPFRGTDPAECLKLTHRDPNRLGEFLTRGVLAIANAGVDDARTVLRNYRLAATAEGAEPEVIARSWAAWLPASQVHDLGARCRRAAYEIFGLTAGTVVHVRLYRQVLGQADEARERGRGDVAL